MSVEEREDIVARSMMSPRDQETWHKGQELIDAALEQLEAGAKLMLEADGSRGYVADRVISDAVFTIVNTVFPAWREEGLLLDGDYDIARMHDPELSEERYLMWTVRAEKSESEPEDD